MEEGILPDLREVDLVPGVNFTASDAQRTALKKGLSHSGSARRSQRRGAGPIPAKSTREELRI